MPRLRSGRLLHALRGGVFTVLAAMTVAMGHGAMAQTLANASMALASGSTTSEQFGTYAASGSYTPAEAFASTSWASTGYNFVFLPTSTVANDSYGNANMSLYSATTTPSDSFNNASPTGGNFMAANLNTGDAAITDTVTGLTPGVEVAISFAWAGAEQTTFTCTGTGSCTGLSAEWTVDLGSSPSQSTARVSYASQNWTGWMTSTFYFDPTSTSEVISFLASGTPSSGSPPFALLANVSVKNVPEPASAVLLLSGLTGLAVFARRRRMAATA